MKLVLKIITIIHFSMGLWAWIRLCMILARSFCISIGIFFIVC